MGLEGNPVATILSEYLVSEGGAQHWPSMTLATMATSGPKVQMPLAIFRAVFPNIPTDCDQIMWPDGSEYDLQGLARLLMGGKPR